MRLQKLVSWINAGQVPPPPPSQAPPPGNGVQGFHNLGVTKPPAPPTYYWAIVKTIPKAKTLLVALQLRLVTNSSSHSLMATVPSLVSLKSETLAKIVRIISSCLLTEDGRSNNTGLTGTTGALTGMVV